MQNFVLEVNNLTKKFTSKTGDFAAVNNLSFSITHGEILGLLGPNGAGKTTTIQMLLGVLIPTTGTIKYFGKEFGEHKEELLQEINFASTYISLPWQFTIVEILEVFARLYNVKNRDKRIDKLLSAFEIDHLKNKNYYQLSAGEKTRVILAKAFLNFPKLILLDEPTASLDPEIAVKVREFLRREKQEYNVSMLFTSHNMPEVEEMCDRVIILNHGRTIEEDTPENLAKKISECEVELTIIDTKKAIGFFEEKEFPYEQNRFLFKLAMDGKNIADFLTLLAQEKIEYQEISINKPELEDYFLKALEKSV